MLLLRDVVISKQAQLMSVSDADAVELRLELRNGKAHCRRDAVISGTNTMMLRMQMS